MPDVTISIRKNGPYVVEGAIALVDWEGKAVEIPAGNTSVKLCRCGASVNKPFCDGTHSRIGFRGAEEAREEFDREKA